MERCSYLDLLTEVEEVSTLGHGKVTQLDFSHCLGDVEGGGVPSLCLPDGLLPQALFGDPLLPLPLQDQDAPHSPPPAAPQPKTLMPVSLPAGQPPASSPASPRPRSPAATPSSPTQPQTPPSPVRVVVRTSRMVAPVTLGKSSRYLVRIPGPSPPQPSPTPAATRRRVLRGGGKLGPAVATAASPSTEVPQSQVLHTSEPPVSTTTTTTTSSTTFRSLGGGMRGGPRQGCSNKRKAYELEPQDDPVMERCRLNAINARRNRELKKAHMAELERLAEEANQERLRLAEENQRLREDNTRLQREVGHLTGVLRNQSRLSHILEKLAPAGGTRSSRQVGGVHP